MGLLAVDGLGWVNRFLHHFHSVSIPVVEPRRKTHTFITMRISAVFFFVFSLFASTSAQVTKTAWIDLFKDCPDRLSPGDVAALEGRYEGTIYWKSGFSLILSWIRMGIEDLGWRGVGFRAGESEVTFFPLLAVFWERIFGLRKGDLSFETDSSLNDGQAVMVIEEGSDLYECRYIDEDVFLCMVSAGLGEDSITSFRVLAKDRHFHLSQRDPSFGEAM